MDQESIFGGAPCTELLMNADIGGIGVRVSFYLQTLLLACLAIRSGSFEEISSSLYTMVATNLAMVITALLLGLKPNPEISLQDGMVILYLLGLSWVPVYASMSSFSRFFHANPNTKEERLISQKEQEIRLLQALSILQSYALFAFTFVMLGGVKSFGSQPACNNEAIFVLFRPIRLINAGRIVCLTFTGLVCLLYTAVLIRDFTPERVKQVARRLVVARVTVPVLYVDEEVEDEPNIKKNNRSRLEEPRPKVSTNNQAGSVTPKTYDINIDWTMIVKIIGVLIIWSLAVMHTELVLDWNFKISNGAQSTWQFGQVLPLFLIVHPLMKTIISFKTYGFRPFELGE